MNTHLFHDNYIFRARLVSLGWTHCISGVACGFDTWVAEKILQMQKENKKNTLDGVPIRDYKKLINLKGTPASGKSLEVMKLRGFCYVKQHYIEI